MAAPDRDPNSAHQRRRRAQRRRQLNLADTIGEVTLGTVVIASALAVGTVHVPVLLGVAALAIIGGLVAASTLRAVPGPALFLLAIAAFCLFQALPLPSAFVARLSSHSAEVWLRCLAPFEEKPLKLIPFSLDAGASLTEALKLLTYAAVYVMAARVKAHRGSSWLALLLFASASAVALVTLVHGVADMDVLYGFYHPDFAAGRWHVGPLLNSNNLAGYLLLGLFAAGGLLLSSHAKLPRTPSLLGVAIMSAALCLSGSRAGLFCAAAGGGIVLLWLIGVQRIRFDTRQSLLGLAPFLVGIALAFGLGTSKEWADIATLDAKRKIVVWGWSLPMIREHALFGVGRGAFETAFSPYRQSLGYDWTVVVTHAENFVVQWIAELGVPVGAIAVVILVGYVVREWRGVRSERVPFLLMTGLLALLVQNLADLGLEVPALGIAAIVALAAGERTKASADDSSSRFGLRVLIPVLPALAVWLGTLTFGLSPVGEARLTLAQAYRELPVKNADERSSFREQLHASMLSHPGESFFPLLGSLVAYRAQDENPLPWVGRALELSPTNGKAHLVLAQLLHHRAAAGQAMLHLRYAAQYDRSLQEPVASLAVQWSPSIDALMQAVPNGPAGDGVLDSACRREAALETRIACFRRAISRNASDPEAQRALAESLLAALIPKQWPCDGSAADACAAEAETAIRTFGKLEPRSWLPGYLLSKLLVYRGNSEAAAELLARVCPADATGEDCARDALDIALKSKSGEAINAAANKFAARPCDSSASCGDALTWLASHLDASGRPGLSVPFYVKAAEADPTAARWMKVAERAQLAQMNGIAHAALERAGRSPDATPGTRAEADRLLQRLARTSPDAP